MTLRELAKVIEYGPIAIMEPHLVGCGAAPEGYYDTVADLVEDETIMDLEVSGICAMMNEEYEDDVILEVGLKGVHEVTEAEKPYVALEVAEFLAERDRNRQ